MHAWSVGTTGHAPPQTPVLQSGVYPARQVVHMQAQDESKIEVNKQQAAEHLAGVHALLKALQDKIGEHPLLAEAILKVEMALNTLGIKTGGMF